MNLLLGINMVRMICIIYIFTTFRGRYYLPAYLVLIYKNVLALLVIGGVDCDHYYLTNDSSADG